MPKEQLTAYNKALDILSRRDHTEYEMRNKLKNKKYTASQINNTINKLFTNNLLNDVAFAEQYITGTIRHKEVGPRWLQQKLKQRGVEDNIINEAIEDSLNKNKQLELIQQAITKWQNLYPKYAADRTRLTRFLLSRGFQIPDINASINNTQN